MFRRSYRRGVRLPGKRTRWRCRDDDLTPEGRLVLVLDHTRFSVAVKRPKRRRPYREPVRRGRRRVAAVRRLAKRIQLLEVELMLREMARDGEMVEVGPNLYQAPWDLTEHRWGAFSASEREAMRRYTDDEMFDHLRRCAREEGSAATNRYLDYGKYHPDAPTVRAFTLRFGTWWDAVSLAGLTPSPNRRGPGRFPPEVCIDAIRQVAEAIGVPPSYNEYDAFRADHPELGLPSPAHVRGQLGGWIDALEAAAPRDYRERTRADNPKGQDAG